MRLTFAAVCVLGASALVAQEAVVTSPIDGTQTTIQTDNQKVRAADGAGALLKGLDKVSGEIIDLEMALGETAEVGRIEVDLVECRYPDDNISGEAFAWLTIRNSEDQRLLFDGWMVASSPALNALDHSRYDVWVIRCTKA